MKPRVFFMRLMCKCTTATGADDICPYTITVYDDLSYIVRWCGGVSSRGTIPPGKYSAQHLYRIFEHKLMEELNRHGDATTTAKRRKDVQKGQKSTEKV